MNLRTGMVITLPLLLTWTAWPLTLTLLHVPLFVVCSLPVAYTLYGLQAVMTATYFLRPDLPWIGVSLAAMLAVVGLGRLTGRLLHDNEAVLLRDGPPVRRVMLVVAVLLMAASILRALPMAPLLCWAAVYFFVGLALPREPVKSTLKERAATVVLLLVSCLVALLLGEAGARILFGSPIHEATMIHRERMRTPWPGGRSNYRVHVNQTQSFPMPITYNEDGLRGEERLGPKSPGVYRILAIGDSFTFGLGVFAQEAYPEQLERILNARAGAQRFEVLNAGVGGSGPYQQWSYFLDVVEHCEPDLVIQQLLPSNDIPDDLTFCDEYLESSNPQYLSYRYFMLHGPYWPIRLQEELAGHSALFATVWSRCGAGWRTLDLGRHFRFLEPLDYPEPGPGSVRPFSIETLLRDWYPALTEGWELNRKHVLLLRDYCAGAGIEYFAFAAPDIIALSDAMWAHIPVAQPQLEGQMHRYDREKNARISRDFFRRNDIPYVDMYGVFRQFPEPRRLFYVYDGHWNLHGCRYAAEGVANALAAWWPAIFPQKPTREIAAPQVAILPMADVQTGDDVQTDDEALPPEDLP